MAVIPEILRWRAAVPRYVMTDAQLAAITAPTLFVWGSGDIFQSPEAGERACAVMPDARLEVVGGGHHPFWDDPRRCASLIEAHLSPASEPA